MKRMLSIHFAALVLAIAGFTAITVPTASGSPTSSQDVSEPANPGPIELGPATVTAVDIPVPPDLAAASAPPASSGTSQNVQPGQPSPGPNSNPQVVTSPAPMAPAVVTTKPATPIPAAKLPPACANLPGFTAVPPTMNRSADGTCTPKCLNHPDFTHLPNNRWYIVGGNCFERGPDAYMLCSQDGVSKYVSYGDVDTWLNNGYGMGIYVDGAGPDRKLNCLITDLIAYGLNPKDFVFSGKYVQDGGPGDAPGNQPFDTPTPYPWSAWKPLYAYWVLRVMADQYVASQSTASIQAYGLLWYGGHRYQSANSFAKYLKKTNQRWQIWKTQNPDLAAALVEHQRLLRR